MMKIYKQLKLKFKLKYYNFNYIFKNNFQIIKQYIVIYEIRQKFNLNFM